MTDRPIVLLGGRGTVTDIVANYLEARGLSLVVVTEEPPDRKAMAKRRARRLGWVQVLGQITFIVGIQPVLGHLGRGRIRQILARANLSSLERVPDHRVQSVNDDGVIDLLVEARPSLVVVNGTRIVAPRVLDVITCPVINMHAGITPRYRGVHGGYWALVEGRPDLVGTTVHLVDPGIDTGGILGQARFEPDELDTFATYPYLHLAAGLPLLAEQASRLSSGEPPKTVQRDPTEGSALYYHPTAWSYLWNRWRRGVR
jgi:hypothetical protein